LPYSPLLHRAGGLLPAAPMFLPWHPCRRLMRPSPDGILRRHPGRPLVANLVRRQYSVASEPLLDVHRPLHTRLKRALPLRRKGDAGVRLWREVRECQLTRRDGGLLTARDQLRPLASPWTSLSVAMYEEFSGSSLTAALRSSMAFEWLPSDLKMVDLR